MLTTLCAKGDNRRQRYGWGGALADLSLFVNGGYPRSGVFMIHNLRSFGVFLLAALSVAGGCGKKEVASVPPSDPRIVGVWISQGGDYPLTNEYRADGTLVQYAFGKTSEPRPFRIEGDLLIYTLKQPDGSVTEQKQKFTLAGDTLTMINSTSKQVFQRQKRG